MTLNTRISWVDTIKFIGLFCVVLGHILTAKAGNASLIVWVYSFHMPLFFCVSGYMDTPSSVSVSLRKSMRGLLIPYAFYYLMMYGYWLVVSFGKKALDFSDLNEWLVKPLLGGFLGCGYDTAFTKMTCIPLWFLMALFICRILFQVLCRLTRSRSGVMLSCMVVLCLGFAMIRGMKFEYSFNFDSALMALPFYVLGFLFRNSYIEKSLFDNAVHIRNVALGLVFFALAVFFSHLNGRVDLASFCFGRSVVLFYFSGFGCIFAFVIFARMFHVGFPCPIISVVKGGIAIMAIHIAVYSWFFVAVERIFHRPIGNISSAFASMVTIIVLVIALPIVVFLRKAFPKLSGIK